jgi:hypothetical protein
MMSQKKDFIGRVMAGRPALVDAGQADSGRVQAGRPGERCGPARISSASAAGDDLENDEGYMTSVAYSPISAIGSASACINGPTRGAARIGERVRAYDPVRNGDVEVEIAHGCLRGTLHQAVPVMLSPVNSRRPWPALPPSPTSPPATRRCVSAVLVPATLLPRASTSTCTRVSSARAVPPSPPAPISA